MFVRYLLHVPPAHDECMAQAEIEVNGSGVGEQEAGKGEGEGAEQVPEGEGDTRSVGTAPIVTELSLIITKTNAHEAERMRAMAEELGVPYSSYMNMSPTI